MLFLLLLAIIVIVISSLLFDIMVKKLLFFINIIETPINIITTKALSYNNINNNNK